MDKDVIRILRAQLNLAKSQRDSYIENYHRLKRSSHHETREDVEDCDKQIENLGNPDDGSVD